MNLTALCDFVVQFTESESFALQQNTVIIIAGPTAVGKTNFAIQLARQFNTQIISADSRQCFKELNIGVAKPTPAQLSDVKHFFINSHSIHDNINAATFETYALEAADVIFQKSSTAIMVGGTGLYIKAFCDGLDAIPNIPDHIRQHILQQYQEKGILFLQEELQQQDPIFWESAEQQNPQRLMRALEVLQATGNSILFYQNQSSVKRPFSILKIALQLPRNLVYERINLRVDEMMNDGLLEEVKSLLPSQFLNALQTVGYKELFDYLNDKTSLAKAVELIKQNTRHYAKRQLTWFRKDEAYRWFAPDEYETIVQYAESKLNT